MRNFISASEEKRKVILTFGEEPPFSPFEIVGAMDEISISVYNLPHHGGTKMRSFSRKKSVVVVHFGFSLAWNQPEKNVSAKENFSLSFSIRLKAWELRIFRANIFFLIFLFASFYYWVQKNSYIVNWKMIGKSLQKCFQNFNYIDRILILKLEWKVSKV